ncbi:MAG TPA: PDZ domain-containing protein [Sphingobium sp.]|nr:PDZ domain-containing protein [Sphingobium sp.]
MKCRRQPLLTLRLPVPGWLLGSFFVPLALAIVLVASSTQPRKPSQPASARLGMTIGTSPAGARKAPAIFITSIARSGPARHAGAHVGDVIGAINGRHPASLAEAEQMMKQAHGNQLSVGRQGHIVRISIS